jgi:methylmalonyl-CoA mutase
MNHPMTTLFDEFAASSPEAWKERLSKDLKGITFEDLSVQDRNGLTIRPFYTPEDLPAHAASAFTHRDWTICASIKVTDARAANQQALHELNAGASGLCFELDGAADLQVLLQDIELSYIHTRFNLSGHTGTFLSNWKELLIARNLQEQKPGYAVYYDVITPYIAGADKDPQHDAALFHSLFDATRQVCVDARIYQNAGANSVWQLSCCLAQLNEYLSWLESEGKTVSLQEVHLSVTTGTDFFEEISKLRALQRLVETLLSAYAVTVPVHLHVETSDTYRSAFDSYSNLLRDTLAGMAAVLGGCHSLLIHPFDQSKNEAGEFSNRMSRNQQLIFKEECYLDQVADAAAGSFYIEQLTAQLAEAAWETFKDIEADGGLIAAFKQGKIGTAIEAQAAEWIAEYRSGKRVLIGVNKYINAKDEPQPAATTGEKTAGLHTVSLTEALAG